MSTNGFALFNGELPLEQPIDGYRVAIDPVLLAASVPKKLFENKRVLDMGCGIGTIGFCLLSRFSAEITGIDIQQGLIDMAKNNALKNQHIDFICTNINQYKTEEPYDAIVMNPPYMKSGTLAKTIGKRLANAETEDAPFLNWMKLASNNLKKGGYIFIIHRTDRLDELLSDMRKTQFGSFTIFPLWAKQGGISKRVIIVARKQKFSSLNLLSGLVLHDENGYTDEANKIIQSPTELKII